MGNNDDGPFWGVVLATAAVAIAGAVALTLSFRTSRDGGRSFEAPAKDKGKANRDNRREDDRIRKPG